MAEIFLSRIDKSRLAASHREIGISKGREEQEKKVVDTENLPEQKIDQLWNLLKFILTKFHWASCRRESQMKTGGEARGGKESAAGEIVVVGTGKLSTVGNYLWWKLCMVKTIYGGNYLEWKLSWETILSGNYLQWKLSLVGTILGGNYFQWENIYGGKLSIVGNYL